MNQGSSSATHDSPLSNNDNSENDDWENIGDNLSPEEFTPKYQEVVRTRDLNATRSTANPPPNSSPSPGHTDPHSHTCTSCNVNGGPSTHHQPPQQQPMPGAVPYYSPTPAYPMYYPTYPTTPGSYTSPPMYLDPAWARLMQVNAALDRPSAPVLLTPEQEARYQNAMAQFTSRHGKTAAETVDDETLNLFMRSLLSQYQAAQSALAAESNGTHAPPPPSQAGPSSSIESLPPPPFPPVLLAPHPPGTVFTPQVSSPSSHPAEVAQSVLSLLSHSMKKLLQETEHAQFRELERRVVTAYSARFVHGHPSLPSTAQSATEYAQPGGIRGNGVNGTSRSSSSVSSASSSFRQPFNPVMPTPEQNKVISEAIIYAQARWPIDCREKECVHLGERDMPPSVSYTNFENLLPAFLKRFGEPLASFLTVLSCFIQDEMVRKNMNNVTLMQNGACQMAWDSPNWETILRGTPPDQPPQFTQEKDEKTRGVLRDALRDIHVMSDNGIEAGISQTAQAYANFAALTKDQDLMYSNQLPIIDPTGRFPPLFPPRAPMPMDESELLEMSEEQVKEMLRRAEGVRDPTIEISPELVSILNAMEAQGQQVPEYSSAEDLLNKLVVYQYYYGVEAIAPVTSHLHVAINAATGLPLTVEEMNRTIAPPPELMPLYPNAKEFRYGPSNVMTTDFSKKKRVEFLELSDDEESDEAGGLHSLPVSIKREYVLGSGSFGTVYEGCVVPLEKSNPKDIDMESDDKKVAIKAINMSWFPTYPYLKKQLDYEVSTLRQCMGFPAIVQFEGFTESPFNTVNPSQHAFIVMELMGCNLEEYVTRQDGRLSELISKVIIRQIQAALNFLHCRGISHCDLKPTNILLNDKSTTLPQIKLSDFGHVRFYGDMINETDICEQTGGLGVANNRGFRAPEHATATGYAPELDLYALGAVSYFIMTGFIPNHTAPRNPVATQTQPAQKSRKGKKAKKMDDVIPEYLPTPSIASLTPGVALAPFDDRMFPDEHFVDLGEEASHLWPYTSKLSYHFCKEHMRIDVRRRINLRDSMDHEWLSGFEMYSMLRRLECKMGLFRPCERHLTTVIDDVNYQRGMLYMAANPSVIQPFSSLSGGGDLSNGTAALLNLYATEGHNTHLYKAKQCPPPELSPLSFDTPNSVRGIPSGPPPSIAAPVSLLPPIPLVEPSKKSNGKTKKKSK